jgi:DNA-binding transcriptional LysR family regulator
MDSVAGTPGVSALHLLLRWQPSRNPNTLADHRAVAESSGSVWWGRFKVGQPGARGRRGGIGAQRVWPTSVARLSQMGPPHLWVDHSNRDLLADLMNGEFEIVIASDDGGLHAKRLPARVLGPVARPRIPYWIGTSVHRPHASTDHPRTIPVSDREGVVSAR